MTTFRALWGTRRRRLLLAVPVVLLLALVATAVSLRGDGFPVTSSGDAGGAGGSSGSVGSLAEPASPDAPASRNGLVDDASEPDAGGSSAKDGTGPGGEAAPMARAVISTGQVTVRAKDLARARSEVLRLTTSWGGTVANEETQSDRRGRVVSSTITLRVPSPRFATAMIALGDLGTVEQTSRASEDVTTQVIDNDARIRAAERSIRQIERLLDRAQALSDVIAIEADLARRQADLDSLKQQQAYLRDQTSLSTVNVYLSRPDTAQPPRDDDGFLAGFGAGWDAMKGATVVLLTILGALLPFAVLALVLGVPLWLVLRRRRGVPPAPVSAEA